MKSKAVVLGASPNTDRYAAIAVKRLTENGYDAVPVGKVPGTIHGKTILTGNPHVEGVDTITLYINPRIQQKLYDYILSLKPRRIIFNPGTENPELEQLANKNGIETTEACTLVLLATKAY
jgi:predicted CoA-binding protein